MNVYYLGDDGESSRKNSNCLSEFRQFATPYDQLTYSLPNQSIDEHKISMDKQIPQFEEWYGESYKTLSRRFSVPEKDYVILRQSREHQLEVVAAFDRHMDPYKQYMQSLLCYDLAPVHGSALLIDSDLPMRKSLLALYQSGHDAAIVINSVEHKPIGMVTVTDCLRAIVLTLNIDSEIGERPVRDFIKKYGKKKLITATVNMSVWDAARLFCLNHVHHIPIFQTDENDLFTDILYMLSLRRIFCITVIKLIEPSFSLAPHIKHRTLLESGIGTWKDIVTVTIDASCGEVIDKLITRKLSCIAVVNEHNMMLGKISKNDIMRELIEHSNNYLEIVNVPVKNVYHVPPFGRPTHTVYEGIALLLSSDDQCLFITDCNQYVMAAVAFTDIMDYILNSSEIHHKISVP
ncbi:5'-AMP-activated protein kinase subunit gamma-1 [Dirofilaria immitis]|nr:5'-AMP-activated protein kinase subunit gamma-1 [Dirofilaria immitis]